MNCVAEFTNFITPYIVIHIVFIEVVEGKIQFTLSTISDVCKPKMCYRLMYFACSKTIVDIVYSTIRDTFDRNPMYRCLSTLYKSPVCFSDLVVCLLIADNIMQLSI